MLLSWSSRIGNEQPSVRQRVAKSMSNPRLTSTMAGANTTISAGVLQDVRSTNLAPQMTAFATLMCDDASTLPAMVLVTSLLQSGTSAQIVVMLSPAVSMEVKGVVDRILPGQVAAMRTNTVPYPFKVRQAEVDRGVKRSCRYTKLRAWSLVSFDRVILLDSDILVLGSLDSLFTKASRTAAVADIYPRVFNAGLIVLAPDSGVHKRLVTAAGATFSYNEGDQGFLNSYFEAHPGDALFHAGDAPSPGDTPWQSLDAKYNFATWLANSIYGKWRFRDSSPELTVIHFSGEVKPWIFGGAGGLRAWERFYAPRLFLQWLRAADEAAAQAACIGRRMRLPVHDDLQPKTLCGIEMCRNASHAPSCRKLACEALAPRFKSGAFKKSDSRVTVVLSTFKGERIPIDELVSHYANSSYVQRIAIVWHDPETPPPTSPAPRRVIKAGDGHNVSVTTFWQTENSLNNRFPIFDVSTRQVLICDDDILVSLDDLAFAFAVARQHPERLSSPFVRSHQLLDTADAPPGAASIMGYFEHDQSFRMHGFRRYSLALTKFVFAPTWLLFVYQCLLDPGVYAYVDALSNCEDIALNLVASAVGLSAPLMIDIPVTDFGSGTDSLSARSSHFIERDGCLPDLAALLGFDHGIRLCSSALAAGRFVSTRVTYEDFKHRGKTRAALVPRLVLERDPSVYILTIEDAFVDATQPTSIMAKTSLHLMSRAIDTAAQPRTHSEDLLLKASLPALKARSRSVDGTRTNLDEQATSAMPHIGETGKRAALRATNYLRNDAVILLKIKRADLDSVVKRDEKRPVVLLDARLERLDGDAGDCPLRIYYLPKWPEDWQATNLTFDLIKNASKISRGSKFFVPLVTAGTLAFFDLTQIDRAFMKATLHPGQSAIKPSNVTFALFYDAIDARRYRRSCRFKSSRGPGAIRPRFDLVKYRQPVI